MPAQVGREQVQRLMSEGAQLVEVVPVEMHRKEHLQGAIGIPLTTMDRDSTARPDATLAEMREHFGRLDLPSSPIATSDGVLVGLLRRDAVG